MISQGMKSVGPQINLKFPTYSFDIYIHHVLNFTPLPLRNLVFGFRLWEFPLVSVRAQSVDLQNRNVKFYCGKSCVFSMEEDTVLKKMALSPLYVYLFSHSQDKGVELIGTSSIHLSDIYLPTQKSPNPYVPERAEDILKKTKRGLEMSRNEEKETKPSNVISVTKPFRSIKGYEVGLYDVDVRIRMITHPSGTAFKESRTAEQQQFLDMRTQSQFFRNPRQETQFSGTNESGNASDLQHLVETYRNQHQATNQIQNALASTFTNLEQQLQTIRTIMDPHQQHRRSSTTRIRRRKKKKTRKGMSRRNRWYDMERRSYNNLLYRHQPGHLYPPSRMKRKFLRKRTGNNCSTSLKANKNKQNHIRTHGDIDSLRKEKQLERLRARSDFLKNTINKTYRKGSLVVSPPSHEWYEKTDHSFHDDLLKNTIQIHLKKTGKWNRLNNHHQNENNYNNNNNDRKPKKKTTTTRKQKVKEQQKKQQLWKHTHDKPSQIHRRKKLAEEKEKKLLRRKRIRNRKRDAKNFLDMRRIVEPEEEFRVIQKPQITSNNQNDKPPQQQKQQQPQHTTTTTVDAAADDEKSIFGDDDDDGMNETFEKDDDEHDITTKKEYKVNIEDSDPEKHDDEEEELEEKDVGKDTLMSTMNTDPGSSIDMFNNMLDSTGEFGDGDDDEMMNMMMKQDDDDGNNNDEDMNWGDNEFVIDDDDEDKNNETDTLML